MSSVVDQCNHSCQNEAEDWDLEHGGTAWVTGILCAIIWKKRRYLHLLYYQYPWSHMLEGSIGHWQNPSRLIEYWDENGGKSKIQKEVLWISLHSIKSIWFGYQYSIQYGLPSKMFNVNLFSPMMLLVSTTYFLSWYFVTLFQVIWSSPALANSEVGCNKNREFRLKVWYDNK